MLHLQNGTHGLKQNTQHSVLKRKNQLNHVLVSMTGSFSSYQILQMMSDDDFAYLMDFSPESVDNMCISLTIELLENKNSKPN
jgi:uncharacterized membrane protein YdbT with pleckstrin-like domain